MAKKRNRYREMERFMTYFLAGDGVVFLLFLLASGLGVTWLKVITALLCIGVSALGIGYLYLSGELLRPRSRWMTVGFAAVLVCLLFSLILRYPSPDPAAGKKPGTSQTGNQQTDGQTNGQQDQSTGAQQDQPTDGQQEGQQNPGDASGGTTGAQQSDASGSSDASDSSDASGDSGGQQ